MSKTVWVINQFAGKSDSGWGERHFFFSKYWTEQGYKVCIVSGSFNHVFNNLPEAPNKYNFEKTENANFAGLKLQNTIRNPACVFGASWFLRGE